MHRPLHRLDGAAVEEALLDLADAAMASWPNVMAASMSSSLISLAPASTMEM